ncbi:MAG: hypothetical protein JWO05_1608 [Gemmatimonadetes bacterium]|nr:hypothetical protein [Gemmatimonadota bacterium]
MKADKPRTTRTETAATSLLAAALLLAAPTVAAQAQAASSESIGFIKLRSEYIKVADRVSAEGMKDGSPVFKDARGHCFTVDRRGDLIFQKGSTSAEAARACATGKHIAKAVLNAQLLGVDAKGNVLMKNAKGETFYLDSNGDMKFVK